MYLIQLDDPNSMDGCLTVAECCNLEVAEVVYQWYIDNPKWNAGYTLRLVKQNTDFNEITSVELPWATKQEAD